MSDEQKISSFEDALQQIAKKYGYEDWHHVKRHGNDVESWYKEAAELYAESKAREAWDRAAFDFNYGLNTAIRKIKQS